MSAEPGQCRIRRAALVLAVAAVFGLGGTTTPAAAGVDGGLPRPDAQIRVGVTGEYQGDGIYSMDDPDQTAYGGARLGQTITYFVRIENDASVPDEFRLKGRGSSTAFSVHYASGGTGITQAVVNGTYTTPVVDPGGAVTVKVTVGVRRAQQGQTFNATLAARSTLDLDARDRVRFITLRRCGVLPCH